jgi:predicted O-methyltransferase YrrM
MSRGLSSSSVGSAPAVGWQRWLRLFSGTRGETLEDAPPQPADDSRPSDGEPLEVIIPSVSEVSVDELGERLGYTERLRYPEASRRKRLTEWRMEDDDAPIFRYLYRNAAPRRHLEFGTWQGTGALYCLEESPATVWTINLLDGEPNDQGDWTYAGLLSADSPQANWAESRDSGTDGQRWFRTDSLGFVGRFYREAGLSHRVCQIYCDSRRWDDSAYPDGFFDTILIDGGHQEEIVLSDSHKAFRLVRPGGLILWHDFCPNPDAYRTCPAVRGVAHAIHAMEGRLSELCSDLFWVRPSWILVGVRK